MDQIEEVSWLEHQCTINASSVSGGMCFALCHIFYYTFQAMEESGLLQQNNSLHKFVLHYIFTPRINKTLQSFSAAWNHHPMRTECHWSPFQMWTNGVLDIRNHSLIGISDIVESRGDVDDLEWFGFDPFAPTPSDDGLSTAEVEDVSIDLSIDMLTVNSHVKTFRTVSRFKTDSRSPAVHLPFEWTACRLNASCYPF